MEIHKDLPIPSPLQIKRLLARVNKAAFIRRLPGLEETVFAQIDCLQCARCCKGYSPRFKTPDVVRISKKMGCKQSDFIANYLRLDEDNDYVTKASPCAFLAENNTCDIYDFKPSDCGRFPYIGEDIFVKKHALTAKNAEFCPAVQLALQIVASWVA